MTQQDKSQSDPTKNQLAEGLRKSKAVGSSPPPAPEAGTQSAGDTNLRPVRQVSRASAYALGGLRWPD